MQMICVKAKDAQKASWAMANFFFFPVAEVIRIRTGETIEQAL
jgi:hypothetical protein